MWSGFWVLALRSLVIFFIFAFLLTDLIFLNNQLWTEGGKLFQKVKAKRKSSFYMPWVVKTLFETIIKMSIENNIR